MLLNKNGVKRFGLLAVVLYLLVVSLFGTRQTYAQVSDHGEGEITFVRLANGEPGDEGIYIINADGSNERPLFLFEDVGLPYDVFNGGYRCPVWSPDGTHIALNGTDGETNYIAIITVDNGDVQRVYEVEHDDQTLRNIYFPEWLPDGTQLSFGFLEAERNTGLVLANGIRVAPLDGSDVITLRDDIGLTEGDDLYIGGPVPNYAPFSHSWSPDGSQLALTLYNWGLYLLDENGSSVNDLSVQWANGDVEWSPDGSTIATSLYRLALINPNDATERELVPLGETLNGSTVESLAWSQDGSEIAYSTMWIDIISGTFTTAFSLSVADVMTGEIHELIRTPSFTGSDYPYNISCVDWRPVGETAVSG